ncbi:alpha/beta hydrolase [Uliginosibacterium sp. 31-12]|uniref:alpha/beta hydrolase n=1 Tax=Uliginosibacterium sp. 31-12 TaxID=3062781 RepID=UPI0026E2DCF7|nr:alpha/beta hydrolase-fold protein [Uliginosibacterium sp. 31-12]MDO6387725.1 alpha/beta hydrolase-fold protein [Uliginosibacterium sp. 31-12]
MRDHPSPISPLRQAPSLALSYRVREPAPSSPKACVILLHGVGGNETNLAELAAAIDPSVLVVLPRGPLQLGFDQYAWFRVAFTPEGPRLDPAEANRAREALLDFIAGIKATYQLGAEQIVLAGFSQGGIMSASVALSEPERVRGFGILSGRILPELAPYLASRERLGSMQAFISHGEQDNVLPVSWALRAEQGLTELGVAYESHRYAAGHVLTHAMQSDFLVWCDTLLGTHSSR